MLKSGKDYLKESLLYNSLLTGDEVRYTDIIKYFIKEYDSNLFNKGCEPLRKAYDEGGSETIKIYREKQHTDIWISKEQFKNSKKNSGFEIPIVLIEVKFKSLPEKEQLKNYTRIFLEKYLESFKILLKVEGKHLNPQKPLSEEFINEFKGRCRKNLKFYLITPFKMEMLKDCNPIVIDSIEDCKENKNDSEKRRIALSIPIIWEHISFAQLGNSIIESIPCVQEKTESKIDVQDDKGINEFKEYPSLFFKDFAQTIISFSEFVASIESLDGLKDKPFSDLIKNSDFEELGLESLHSKIRASQCANLLDGKFKGLPNYEGKLPPKYLKQEAVNVGSIVVSQGYSNNGGGLFEIARKVDENIDIILQYQNKEIRKGLIIEKGSAFPYDGWFKDKWKLDNSRLLEFKTKEIAEDINPLELENEELYNYYSVVKNETTMYYSTFRLNQKEKECPFAKNLTVEEVLFIMKSIILNDNPEKRTNSKTFNIR